MPLLGIHYLALDAFEDRLKRSAVATERDVAAQMQSEPALASLGCIGPDVFYYMDSPAGIVAAMADVFDGLNQIGTILDAAAKLAADAGLPNLGKLVRELSETAKLIIGTVEVKLEKAVIDLNDLVYGHYIMTQSASQDNEPETNWKWGDLLHDRASGVFARALRARAASAGNAGWAAFSAGYLTHLATDFTGHPFVNQVVGGPARGYLMRHTVAEKFMDATAYASKGSDINTSRLHRRTEPLLHTVKLDDLCQMLASEIANLTPYATAHGFALPAPPTPENIRDAIERMNSLFRLVTEQSIVPPPIAPSISIPPLPGQYGSITNAVGSLFPPGRPPHTLTDWLKALLALLLGFPALIADIARFITDIAIGKIGYPIEAALYVLQSALYLGYRRTRWFLVMSGVAFPLRDEINSSIGRQFITAAPDRDNYPHVPQPVTGWRERWQAAGRTLEFDASNLDYLSYPSGRVESPGMRPSPYRTGRTPDYFISLLQQDLAYIAAWLAAGTPQDVRRIIPSPPPDAGPQIAGFGSAVDMSLRLLHATNSYDQINLDSDRGYGYKQWKCDGGITAGNLINERFI